MTCSWILEKLLSPITKFLGIAVKDNIRSFSQSQKSARTDALDRFSLSHVKPLNMAMGHGIAYNIKSIPLLLDLRIARGAIRTLLWFANANRPNISFAPGIAARHREKSRASHWQLIKRIFRNLMDTLDLAITFMKSNPPTKISDLLISIWNDADF